MENAKTGRRWRRRVAGGANGGSSVRWLAPLLALAVLAAGCGGDGRAGGEGADAGAEGTQAGADSGAVGAEAQTPAGDVPGADRGDSGTAEAVPGAEADPAEDPADSAEDPADDSVELPAGSVAVDEFGLAFDTLGFDTLLALGPPRRVPAGTRIRVTIDDEISTDVYRPGDAVIATVADDVTDPAGEVLIPRGVKLLGRILTSAGSPGVDEPPILELAFETLSALNAEWPVEGAVINVPVVVDSRADIARRFQRGRSVGREVPGRVREGAVVLVELRADVHVGPMVGPEALPEDTVPGLPRRQS